jgi:branched-chain amino acid transport system substrate-binding protein
MKKTCFILLSLTLTLSLIATSSFAAKTIRLGIVEPLSGTFKDQGDRYLAGAEFAVNEINANGGLLGQQIELFAIDSEVKPDVASRKASKLMLKKDVKFFAGGIGSSVGAAMSVLAQKNDAIMISYGMAAASLTGEKCSRNFFRTSLNTDNHSYAMAYWVANSGAKKVIAIGQDYSFGHEAIAAFNEKLKQLNPDIEIAKPIFHKIGEKDFAPYVSQVIASGAEIVFSPNWGNDLSLLIKQGKSLGLESKIVSYYLNDPYLVQGISDDDSVIGNITGDSYMVSVPTPENKAFTESFKKEKGYYPTGLTGKSYAAIKFWAEAVKKAGSTDVDEVINAWEGLTYKGVAGEMTMRAGDHQTIQPAWVATMVKDQPYFDHAFVSEPEMVPAEVTVVPLEATGCHM